MSKVKKDELKRLREELDRARRRIESLEHELGKLNRITEMVKDLVIMTDDNGIIRQTSHALNPTLGYNLQDIEGRNIFELIHPGDQLPFEIFLKQLKSKTTSNLLHRIKTKSGKYIWIETSGTKSIRNGADLVFYLRDLSDRMKLQNDLLASHNRYKSLLENLPFVIFRYDRNLKHTFVSSNVSDLLPFEPEEIMGSDFSELGFDKERSDFFNQSIQEVFEKGQNIEREFQQHTQKGSLDLTWKLFPEYDENGRIANVLGILEDVTELKKIQREKRTSEEKFQHIFNTIPDSVVLSRFSDGLLLDVNQGFLNFTGYDKEEVINRSSVDIKLFKNRESREEFVNELKKGPIVSKEFLLYTKDRQPVEVLISSAPIELFGEELLISIFRNISEIKENERRVLLYKDIFDKNEDGIAILNTDGTFREINNAYQNIIGYSFENLKGKDSSVFLGEQLYSEVFTVYNFQNIFDGELKAITHDEKEIYLDYLLFPVKTEEETLCIVQIIRDITERKQAETNLIEAKRRAEDADKLKTAFLSNMSHEIRTPMNSILGFSTLLANSNLTDQQRVKYIEFINKNGENLLNLIGDIIDIAKIESNQLRIKKGSCNLNYLVTELKESLEKVKELEGKTKVDLRLSYDSDKIISIYTDCHRLRQIMVNLIYNAIKFTHEGYIDFGYRIQNEEELLFHVRDTGIGIPEKMIDKIFERFHKNETSVKKSYGGAGLGLAISSQLVKLLGGKIWVESDVGKGTSFYFTLPYVKSGTRKVDEQTEEESPRNWDWKSKKVLVVEDDSFNAELISEFLSDTNIKILYADDGKKAVDVFTENKDTDAVIMDIRLPEINGIEATKLIRKIRPDVPVLAQTAFAMEEDRMMAKSAGFNEYMVKPLNKKEFLVTLARYLGDDINP